MNLNDQVITKNRSGLCTLIIREVTLADAGDYSCKATNDEGEDEISTKVTVKGQLFNTEVKVLLKIQKSKKNNLTFIQFFSVMFEVKKKQ